MADNRTKGVGGLDRESRSRCWQCQRPLEVDSNSLDGGTEPEWLGYMKLDLEIERMSRIAVQAAPERAWGGSDFGAADEAEAE